MQFHPSIQTQRKSPCPSSPSPLPLLLAPPLLPPPPSLPSTIPPPCSLYLWMLTTNL